MALYIDGKKFPLKDVFKILGVNEKEIPSNNRRRIFEINNRQKDTLNGGYRFFRRFGGTPEFTCFSKTYNYDVAVRYAKTVSTKLEGGISVPKYTPKHLFIEPMEDGSLMAGADYDEFVFWFLHPSHELSPFHKFGTKSYYKYIDLDNRAKVEITNEELLINALSLVIGNNALPMMQLRKAAKGMMIGEVDDMTDNQVRDTLKNLAKQNPTHFYAQIKSRDVTFNGTVRDAIDKGILKLLTYNNIKRWYLGGDEIMVVPYGADENQAVLEEISKRMEELWTKMVNLVEGRSLSTELSRPENDKYFESSLPNVDAENRADLGLDLSKELQALKILKQNPELYEKAKQLASTEITPNLHHMTKASIEKHQDEIKLVKLEEQGLLDVGK